MREAFYCLCIAHLLNNEFDGFPVVELIFHNGIVSSFQIVTHVHGNFVRPSFFIRLI